VFAQRIDERLLIDRLVGGEEDFLLAGEIALGEVDGDESWQAAERLTDARLATASHDARHGDGVVVIGLGGGLAAGFFAVTAAGKRGDREGGNGDCD
jgi:hypothetical protein